MVNEPVIGKGQTQAAARQRRLKYWRAVFSEQAKSGLGPQHFCRKHEVSSARYYWWRREVLREDQKRTKRKRSRASFSRVKVLPQREPAAAAPRSASYHYEISLRGGRHVRIREDFDPEVLKKLVRALEDLPC